MLLFFAVVAYSGQEKALFIDIHVFYGTIQIQSFSVGGLRSMKCIFKKLSAITVACLLVFSLISCGNGINGDEAKAHINEFLAAVAAEDYDKAESLLHPERPKDLKAFFSTIEKEEHIDFQSGIEIEKYTGFSSTYYDSRVDGSRYELTMRTRVGTDEVTFTIEIVSNEIGYGIYSINIGV